MVQVPPLSQQNRARPSTTPLSARQKLPTNHVDYHLGCIIHFTLFQLISYSWHADLGEGGAVFFSCHCGFARRTVEETPIVPHETPRVRKRSVTAPVALSCAGFCLHRPPPGVAELAVCLAAQSEQPRPWLRFRVHEPRRCCVSLTPNESAGASGQN